MDDSEDIAAPNDRIRERVVLALALLASDAGQTAGHRDLPPDQWAYAWCHLWFDEVYTPSTRYLDGIKGDRSEEAAVQFWAAFTADERDALERFHRFLELRMDMLSEADRERAAFPQNDAWNAILRHATYVLDELNPDSDALQQKVSWLIDTLTREEASTATDALLSSLAEALQLPQSE